MDAVFETYMSRCAEQFFESPALNAIGTATAAVEEDKKGNYVEALRLYELALEQFRHASREARTNRLRKLFRKKCELYSDRAKQIRKYLQKQGEEVKKSCDGNSEKQEDYLLSDDDEFPKNKRWFLLCC